MILHEYEAKEILGRYGVATPKNKPIRSLDEVDAVFSGFEGTVVLKPLGMKKRGKAGYVFFLDSKEEAMEKSKLLFGVQGVKELLMEHKHSVKSEFYLGIALDHSAQKPVFIISSEGGVDIEEVGRNSPEKIKKVHINVLKGPEISELRSAISSFGFDGKTGQDLESASLAIWKMFVDHDAELVEINPLAQTSEGGMVALDCLFKISDDALFRHPEFAAMASDRNYSTELERQAGALGWSYLDMDGDIGILSSGAGLTMAILDLMQLYGGKPANFLDTAQMGAEEIFKAFDLVLGNKNAKVVFVNIFAGLNRCDHLAEGIKKYVTEKKPSVPIVVRMIGNKEDEGFEILRAIGIEPIKELEPAVQKAVDTAKQQR